MTTVNTIMQYLSWTVIFFSFIVLCFATFHYLFFRKGVKHELANRISFALLGEILAGLSVMLYNLPMLFILPTDYFEADWLRLALKGFQAIATAFTAWASWRLLDYYWQKFAPSGHTSLWSFLRGLFRRNG